MASKASHLATNEKELFFVFLKKGQTRFGGDGGLVTKSSSTLMTPWTVALQDPLSMGFSRQEYWSELPFPSARNHSDPRNEPVSPAWPLGH